MCVGDVEDLDKRRSRTKVADPKYLGERQIRRHTYCKGVNLNYLYTVLEMTDLREVLYQILISTWKNLCIKQLSASFLENP